MLPSWWRRSRWCRTSHRCHQTSVLAPRHQCQSRQYTSAAAADVVAGSRATREQSRWNSLQLSLRPPVQLPLATPASTTSATDTAANTQLTHRGAAPDWGRRGHAWVPLSRRPSALITPLATPASTMNCSQQMQNLIMLSKLWLNVHFLIFTEKINRKNILVHELIGTGPIISRILRVCGQ